MRFTLLFIAAVAWALWIGATFATFVFPYFFFHRGQSDAVSTMFVGFSRYELVLAGLALIAAGLLLVTWPSKSLVMLIAFLVLAGAVAVTFSMGILPQMEAMRLRGEQQTDLYHRWHSRSVACLTVQALLLLIDGAILLVAVTPARRIVDIETADREFEPRLQTRGGGLSQRV